MVEEEKVVINLEYEEQAVRIGSDILDPLKEGLTTLLKTYIDVFAWKPKDMTGILRTIITCKAKEANDG